MDQLDATARRMEHDPPAHVRTDRNAIYVTSANLPRFSPVRPSRCSSPPDGPTGAFSQGNAQSHRGTIYVTNSKMPRFCRKPAWATPKPPSRRADAVDLRLACRKTIYVTNSELPRFGAG